MKNKFFLYNKKLLVGWLHLYCTALRLFERIPSDVQYVQCLHSSVDFSCQYSSLGDLSTRRVRNFSPRISRQVNDNFWSLL